MTARAFTGFLVVATAITLAVGCGGGSTTPADAGLDAPATTVPSAPGVPAATASDQQVSLAWAAPADDGGAAITGYVVTPFIGSTAQTPVSIGNVSAYVVAGLTNGTTYTFTVAATNGVGTGAASAPSNPATPGMQPGTPAMPSITGVGNGSVSLTWGAPSSTGGSPLTGYVVTPYVGATAQTPVSTGSASTSFTVTGLTNGTTYTFTVAATNSYGNGAASAASAGATPGTEPGAPGTPSIAAVGSGTVSLTWTAPTSDGGAAITDYVVTPYIGATAQTPLTTGSSSTSFMVTGLTNGTTYTFTVAATNSFGTGTASAASATATPGTPPDAPGIPTVTGVGNGSASLSWTMPASDGGATITSYVVTPYIGATAQTPIPTGTATTTFNVTGLTNGTTYTFTVAATNSFGTGTPSNASAAATPGTQPSAPGTPTVTAVGNGSVSLSWTTPASDGGAAITGYVVTPYVGATAQTPVPTGSTSTSFMLTGLTNGTTYSFTVAAINSFGTGAASSSSAFATPGTLPDAPGMPTVTGVGDGSASLSWTMPASDGGATITSYVVTPYIGATAQTPIPTGAATTTFNVTGLTNGTTYTFKVAATNTFGTGAASAASTAATPGTQPSAPGTPTVTAVGNGSVSLSWSAPASNGGASITGYVVTPYIGATAQTSQPTGSTSTSFAVTGLINGTTYTFKVAATNSFGTGAASPASASATPGTTPSAPGTPTITGTGNGSVSLSWTAPASDGGDAITGYVVTPYVGATAQTPVPTGSTSTSFMVTGLTNGTTYTFKVAATNSFGTGAPSLASSSATPASLPDAPTSVTATPGNAQVSLTWTAPANNGSAITSYQVTPYIGGVAQTPIATGSSATSFTVTSLTNGTTYTFTVAATNAIGTGPASTPSNSATPGSVPGAPTGVSATAGNGSVALSWSAPSSDGGSAITSYRITPYIGATAQTPINTGSASTSSPVTGLTNGTTYTFMVAATNAIGTGASASSGTVTPVGPPTAPRLVTATAGDGSVSLTWQAPVNNGGSAITGYVVTPYAAGVAQTPITLGNVLLDTISGLTNGTRYQFTVAAINANGTGPTSASNAVTPASGNVCLGTPIFSDVPVLSAHTSPIADATGDFDGDGLPDLAIANLGSGDVSVLLGNGDGTFKAPQNYTAIPSPKSVLAADFNGDGLSDLVLTAQSTNQVYVMLDSGTGTFGAPVPYTPAGSTSFAAVAVGDFNADGRIDLAVGSGTQVSIFLGTGSGTFGAPTAYSGTLTISSIAVSTFNPGSALDVAVSGSTKIGVWLGIGDGTFGTQKTTAVGDVADKLAVGDYNKDGQIDVAVTTNGNDIIYTLSGNGDGTFGTAAPHYDNNPTAYLSSTDFNGDGYADLVVTNSGNTSIFKGGGAGISWLGNIDAVGSVVPAVGDFNRDGHPDIALGTAVFLGNGDATFLLPSSYGGIDVYGLHAADLSGDGKTDLVAASYSNAKIYVYLGPVNGTATTYSVGTNPVAVTSSLFNADVYRDLVVANSGSANITVLSGVSGGTFTGAKNYAAGSAPWGVTTGDFNGDSYQDIAVANKASGSNVDILLGDGAGNFGTAQTFAAGSSPVSIATADFNGNSALDLVTANSGSSNVSVMLGAGDGTFSTATTYTVGSGPNAVAVGDLGNGQIDIVTANYTNSSVSVLLGNGNGTFQTATSYIVASSPTGITIGDVNGDAKVDLVVANSTVVTVLLGNGDGTFQAAIKYASTGTYDTLNYGHTATCAAIGDFNNDGRADIGIGTIGGGFFASTVTIMPYSGCD